MTRGRTASRLMPILAIGLLLAIAGGEINAEETDVVAQQIGHSGGGPGQAETDVGVLNFSGTFLTKSRANQITPGTKEAVAITAIMCDAGTIANKQVQLLPPTAAASPTIAGGLGALPCVQPGPSDGFHTGLSGAIMTFSGSQVEFLGTVRMYADVDRDGALMEPGDLVSSAIPQMQQDGTAIAQFGQPGGQIMSNGGLPLMAVDPACATPACAILGPPLLLTFTVDIDPNATGGTVNTALGLTVGSDDPQGAAGICTLPGLGGFNCGSVIRGGGPETDSFTIAGSGGGSTGPPPGGGQPPGGGSSNSPLKPYDEDGDDDFTGDDSEFFSVVDAWVADDIDNAVFFDAIDVWLDPDLKIADVASAGLASGASVELQGVDARLSAGGDRATFVAQGRNIAETELRVYDLSGQRLAERRSSGDRLTWDLRTSTGQRLANGVYLYSVTAVDAQGRSTSSGIRKLSIVR